MSKVGVPASAGKTQEITTTCGERSIPPAEAGTPTLRLGIFAKTFVRPTVEATFDVVAAHKFDCVQFNFACAGLPSVPEQISPALPAKIATAAKMRGLEIAAVSGTFNMIHSDKAQRDAGFRGLEAIAASCQALGTRLITLCTGTRDPNDMWRAHPDNDSENVWRDLLASMQRAVQIAERHDLCLGIEPELANVINSAPKARRLLDEMKSPRLRIIMDGANLLRPSDMARARSIWQGAFDLLAPDIAMVHAKDITNDGRFVAAGKGALDYRFYVELIRKANFTGPFVLHGLAENEVENAAIFLRDTMKGTN